jgi:hypothetical protein
MKNKSEIRKIVRSILFENFNNQPNNGEYSTEEMDRFINEISNYFDFESNDRIDLYQLRNAINVPLNRTEYSFSTNKDDLLYDWGLSKKFFENDNPIWRISLVETKEYSDKSLIDRFGDFKYDKNSVIDFIKNNPDKVKKITISADSESQDKFADFMKDYSGRRLYESIRGVIRESLNEIWTQKDWDEYFMDESSSKLKELKDSIVDFLDSDDFYKKEERKDGELVKYVLDLSKEIYNKEVGKNHDEYYLVDACKLVLRELSEELMSDELRKKAKNILDEFEYRYEMIGESSEEK